MDRSSSYVYADGDGFTLALAFGPDGLLYYIDGARQAIMRLDPAAGNPEVVAIGSIGGHELVIPNALAFDRAGSLYITESYSPTEPGPGVYRIDPDGNGTLWNAGPFLFANGIAVAPDQSAVYVAETWARRSHARADSRRRIRRLAGTVRRTAGNASRRPRLRTG